MINENRLSDITVLKDIFAERLKKARLKKGYTQEDLTEDGLSLQTISAYENSRKCPSIFLANILANRLGVSLDWLCGNDKRALGSLFTTSEALLMVLKVCEPTIVIENDKAMLIFDKNTVENNNFTIKRFVEKYSHILTAKEIGLEDEMIDTLEESLLKQFINLPQILDYSEDL